MLYLHMSLFQQRLVAVRRGVGYDHAVVLTLRSETFVQKDAKTNTLTSSYHPQTNFCCLLGITVRAESL